MQFFYGVLTGVGVCALALSFTWNMVQLRWRERWVQRAVALENLRQSVQREIDAAQVERDTIRRVAQLNLEQRTDA